MGNQWVNKKQRSWHHALSNQLPITYISHSSQKNFPILKKQIKTPVAHDSKILLTQSFSSWETYEKLFPQNLCINLPIREWQVFSFFLFLLCQNVIQRKLIAIILCSFLKVTLDSFVKDMAIRYTSYCIKNYCDFVEENETDSKRRR